MKKQGTLWGSLLLGLLVPALPGMAQVSIPATATPVTVNFNGFTGTGFQPAPAAGQLDSDDWSIVGFSDGVMNYGDTKTTGDFARGITAGDVSSGGLYALTYSGDTALMIQPTSSDFNGGTITLRLQNNTGSTVSELDLAYDIIVLNNEDRSNSFNFSYSIDDISYTSVAALDYISVELQDAGAAQVVPRSTTLSGLNVLDGGFIYLRWRAADVSGGGSRDEFGLDNISATASSGASAAVFEFSTSSLSASESDASASVDLNLSETADCSVDVIISGGSATEGLDYSFSAPLTLNFTDGGPVSQLVNVGILDDLDLEGSEDIVLQLSNATGSCLIGAVSQVTIALADNDVAPFGACANLYFSEYLEGSSNNKALEIYNPTNAAVDLSGYIVRAYNNGAVLPTNTLVLSGSLAAGDVYVIANNAADSIILAQADTTSSVTNFNGDDAIVLFNGGDTIDIIGVVGIDPGTNWPIDTLGATSEYTLVRLPSVNQGQLDWALGELEWDVYPQNTFDFIGNHEQVDCAPVCSTDSLPTNQSHTLLATVVKLGWTPPAAIVACQVEGQRLPSGPSPRKNIVSAPYNTLVVPRALAGAGTTWTWKVRCACSVDPLEVSAFTEYGDTFMIPAERQMADLRGITVYPNPAAELVVLNYTADQSGDAQLDIVDVQGRIVYSATVAMTAGQNRWEVGVSELNPGLYFVQFDGQEGLPLHIVR